MGGFLLPLPTLWSTSSSGRGSTLAAAAGQVQNACKTRRPRTATAGAPAVGTGSRDRFAPSASRGSAIRKERTPPATTTGRDLCSVRSRHAYALTGAAKRRGGSETPVSTARAAPVGWRCGCPGATRMPRPRRGSAMRLLIHGLKTHDAPGRAIDDPDASTSGGEDDGVGEITPRDDVVGSWIDPKE